MPIGSRTIDTIRDDELVTVREISISPFGIIRHPSASRILLLFCRTGCRVTWGGGDNGIVVGRGEVTIKMMSMA
jgi:hypothetical protein